MNAPLPDSLLALGDVPTTPEVGPAPETGVRAHDLVDMLRRHYQPEGRQPAGLFAAEIEAPEAHRRADVIWLPTTIAGGRGQIHGHEIKVSRADVLAELADPTKADPWAQYCTFWWLVVAHPRLVSGLDIPAAWGVMAPPSGRRTRTMTVVRPAPQLIPRDPGPALYKLAAWLLYETDGRISLLDRTLSRTQALLDAAEDKARRAVLVGGAPTKRAEMVARIVAAVERRFREEHMWGEKVDEDLVVAAIVDYAATADAAEAVRRRIDYLMAEVRQVLAPFEQIKHNLERAAKLATKPAPEVAK